MSVEGLLSEVTAILGSRLAIKAGDQAFFGDKQVYTNVSTASTSSGKAAGCDDKKKEDVSTVLHSVKHIVKNALGCQAVPASGSNDKAFADITALKKENQEIKKEIAELRKLLQELTTRCSQELVIGTAKSVLILGDGNLSFSRAFATMWPSKSVTATVLEPEDMFAARYAGGAENIFALRSLKNTQLLFEVDATVLPETWKGKYDTIVMNFPHPGGKSNLKRSRLLARHVFRSVRSIMDDTTTFHLSLAYGQPGFDALAQPWIPFPPQQNPDSWQILTLAAEEYLLLKEAFPMFPTLFPGYLSSGYKSTSQGFNNRNDAVRLVFSKAARKLHFDELAQPSCTRIAPFCSYRPHFVRDISFLYKCCETEINYHESQLLEIICGLCGGMIGWIHEIQDLRSICPEPLLPNRIYRLYWQTLDLALTRKLCNELDYELRLRIQDIISRENLPLILT